MEELKNIELNTVQQKSVIFLITKAICFAIVINDETNEVVVLKKEKQTIDFNLSSFDFNNVQAFLLSDQFTLIPTSIFNPKNIEAYLDYTSEVEDANYIEFDEVKARKLNLVWSLKQKLKSDLVTSYPNIQIKNLLARFIERNELGVTINSLFLESQLVISVLKDGELQLVNAFKVNNAEDALYYHLLVLQHLNLPEEKVNIKTGGFFDEEKQFQLLLDQYFSTVNGYNNSPVDFSEAGFLKTIQYLFNAK